MTIDKSCIEVEMFPMHNHKFLSVRAYEGALRTARSLSNPRALSFHGVIWAQRAPAVEKLTTDWQATKEAQIRVSDHEAYHAQMLDLLGLGDLIEAGPA